MLAGVGVPPHPRDSALPSPGHQGPWGSPGRQKTTGQTGGCEGQEWVVSLKVKGHGKHAAICWMVHEVYTKMVLIKAGKSEQKLFM